MRASAEALVYDLRHSLRSLLLRPAFTAVIALTFAFGIGVNATMFGLLDRLLFRAPPHIVHPGRVVLFNNKPIGAPWFQTSQSYALSTLLRKNVPAFAEVTVATPAAAGRRQYFPTGSGATASRVAGSLVDANYFSLLGVRPALGRFFAADDEQPTDPRKLAVLGYGYWQRRYAGRRDVLGQSMQIGTSRYTIIGVAPKGFTGAELRDVDVWLPVVAADGLRFANGPDWMTNRNAQWLLIYARLAPGVSVAQAEAQATVAYRNLERERLQGRTRDLAWIDSETVVLGSLIPAKSHWSNAVAGSESGVAVSKLLGAVAFLVLLIACANVANLLLVRALGRRREIAVRLALGVSRRRLVSQLVIEGLLLALVGAAGALVVTVLASPILRRWMIGDGAWTSGVIDGRVLVFTVGVALITGIITSLVPALQASRPDVTSALKAGAREGSVQRSTTRAVLLVAQAALAIILLTGAGLFVRSLHNAASLDLGLDVNHVLVAQVNHKVSGLTNEQAQRMYLDFADRARAIPGVQSSAVSIGLPFNMSWGTQIYIPGRTLARLDQQTVQYGVTKDYFDALGIHLQAGRTFTSADRGGTLPVAVINETMARIYWPQQNPVGICVNVGADTMPCTTIVGVVSNTRRQDLVEGLVPQIYRPLEQLSPAITNSTVSFFGYTLVVHTRGNADDYVEPLRRAIQSAGASVPYANITSMQSMIAPQTRAWELGARVFTAFGALALLLAGLGLFSVVTFTMSQRRHELGVRTALGAQRIDLLRLTLVRGTTPAVIGIVVGAGLTVLASRFLDGLLFQESPRDPVVIGAACGVLVVCAVAASLGPAMGAARVDPTIALRAD